MTPENSQIGAAKDTARVPLLTTAAFAPLPDLGWLRVTGSDRVRWLNGMVTNSIQSLQLGEGCYNFVLNAQGRIQADLTAFAQQEDLLLETGRTRLPALIALLDKFIIMDDVELTPLEERTGLLVAGPEAPYLLQAIGIDTTPNPGLPLQHRETHWQALSFDLIHAHSPLVPRFELWASPNNIALLTQALQQAGATQATPEAIEQLRLLEATPLYGTDIREKDLPQETAAPGLTSRALHFAKGCYLGQEIVERVRSRGNVHRTLAAFILEGPRLGPLPAPGTPLTAAGPAGTDAKPIGEITSAARIELPTGQITLALGTIRREALDLKQRILYPEGEAKPSPVPYPLQTA